jgi:hypothetical protein
MDKYGRRRFVRNGQPDGRGYYIRSEYAVVEDDPQKSDVVIPLLFPEGIYYAYVDKRDILSRTDHPTLDTPGENPTRAVIKEICDNDAWKAGTCVTAATVYYYGR